MEGRMQMTRDPNLSVSCFMQMQMGLNGMEWNDPCAFHLFVDEACRVPWLCVTPVICTSSRRQKSEQHPREQNLITNYRTSRNESTRFVSTVGTARARTAYCILHTALLAQKLEFVIIVHGKLVNLDPSFNDFHCRRKHPFDEHS
mmetsp:Transcript_2386/g.5514  ORF Transcript_2386/g.5514 Transcript_2386/m.5514 type:complete len:145 (+) Transcript_2386:532-966(+)